MNRFNYGVEINDVELETVDAGNAGDNFAALIFGFGAVVGAPIAFLVEAISPGPVLEIYKDLFTKGMKET
ncbi:MAG TPA: hypothetical protein VF797_02415 [Noviherbaspirillum sp.]|jgi:hypothetical protein